MDVRDDVIAGLTTRVAELEAVYCCVHDDESVDAAPCPCCATGKDGE